MIDDGGPAFAKPCDECSHRCGNSECNAEQTGMSLRDYFASAAMQAIIANPAIDALEYHEVASDACGYADAMIAKRRGGPMPEPTDELTERALCDKYPKEVWFRLAYEDVLCDIVSRTPKDETPDTTGVLNELAECARLDQGWRLSDGV